MLGALVWICCLTVVAAQGRGFVPQPFLGDEHHTTTPIPILKDSRRIDLHTGAFVYEYIGGDGSSKFEFRFPNGTVIGNFSFINENGELETRVYNHGAEVDETTDPNYIDLGNYEYWRHLEQPYEEEQSLGPQSAFVPQQLARPTPRRRQRPRRPQTAAPQIQIQPQFQPIPQPPQQQPQPQFRPQPQAPPQPQFRPQPQAPPQPQFQQPQPQFQPQPQTRPQPQQQFRPQPQQQPQFHPQPAQNPAPQQQFHPQPQPRISLQQAPQSRSSRPSLIDTPTFQIPAPRPRPRVTQRAQQRQQPRIQQQRHHRLDLSHQQGGRNDPDTFLDSVIARFN
ncbi:protein TsetseEP-like [Scylla paramamosain]|uniref:protein TsetseEP-like n=1 Tax=Scylla paramamosain TaxID=85552 RepID=UPI003083936E